MIMPPCASGTREELGQEQQPALLGVCEPDGDLGACKCLQTLGAIKEIRLPRLQPSRTISVCHYYLPSGRFLYILINYFQIPWLSWLSSNIFKERGYVIKCQV